MSRISIDVTEEEHRQLKVLAAATGQSMKELLVDPRLQEEEALRQLLTILDERAKGPISKKTMAQIRDEAMAEYNKRKGK